MLGLTKTESNAVVRKLFENNKLRIADNKIVVTDIEEIDKQTKYYRKMEKIEKARKQGSMKNR